MGDKTKIEWADATWNPVTGCHKVSPGCDHCYAERVTERFQGPGSFEKVVLHPDRLDQPLRWRRPRRIFVNSMSDVFHEQVPDDYIARVFAVMAQADQHTFQILTKRHGRVRSLLSSPEFFKSVDREWCGILDWFDGRIRENGWWNHTWPLPNVWLGVSVEDQKWADIRIPALLDTPAAVRFLSCEPLLGPIDLLRSLSQSTLGLLLDDCLRCCVAAEVHGGVGGHEFVSPIGWVIAGGESGPGARPMYPDWARSLRDQCVDAGVPFLFKQWGEWAPKYVLRAEIGGGPKVRQEHVIDTAGGLIRLHRVGKKAAGRELDRRTWDQYPDHHLLERTMP